MCSGQNWSNSLCQLWNDKSSSNFASFFIVMTHSSSAIFKLIHFLLWTKVPHQSPNFDTFKCSDVNLLNSSCHFPNRNQFFVKFSITLHNVIFHNVSVLLYFKHYIYCSEGTHLKWIFWRLSSDRVTIHQIPHVIFKTTSQFLNFYIIPHCDDT